MKKRVYSLALVMIMLFSAISFAEEQTRSLSSERSEFDSDLYEKSIRESEPGTESQGKVIVNHEEEKDRGMTDRFMRGEVGEDEMRQKAKAMMGSQFSEEEFQRGMRELKERMHRKEAFSYEHKGYGQYEQSYDVGPSYEGYSKEHMIFGLVFEQIGDEMDPREIKQYCNEPEKIADNVIAKFKEKVGDSNKFCSKMDEQEAKCNEHSKKVCAQIGTALVRDDATEIEKIQAIAYSCPVRKDAIVESCKARSKFYTEQRVKNADEECRKRFDYEGERLIRECEKFKQSQVCDKDNYIEHCLKNFGARKEDFDESGKRKPICPKYPVPTCGEGSVLKTKTDANGCIYYYCEAVSTNVCPPPSLPLCAEGYTLQKKVDDKGCVSYHCEPNTAACPTDVQQCPDGSYVQRVPPNCDFAHCPTFKCPEAIVPSCGTGQTLQKKTDSNGCLYYHCEQQACPQVTKPSCAADETLQVYYDNAGCVSSYQCIKHETTCPSISKPTCAEGQSLTVRYDDKRCVVGYECVGVTTTTTSSQITGQVVLNTYNDFVIQCENQWADQQRICLDTPKICDKETFIEKCKEQEQKDYGDYLEKIEEHCERETQSEIKHAEQRCARLEEDRQRCFEDTAKRCEHMKGVAQQCRETLTEENLRKFIIEEAKKKCKFADIVHDEEDVRKAEKVEIVLAVLNTATKADIEKLELFIDDLEEELKLQDTTVYKGKIDPNRFGDVKLFPFVVNAKISTIVSAERAKEVKAKIVAREKVEEAASQLVSLRDSDVPKEYLYIIEDKASEIVDVSEGLEEQDKIEAEKGIGYKLKRFLGLAQKQELLEVEQLKKNIEKLDSSITALSKVAEEVPSDVAEAIIKEQVENLKTQKQDIQELIETKEKKAKGFLALFG